MSVRSKSLNREAQERLDGPEDRAIEVLADLREVLGTAIDAMIQNRQLRADEKYWRERYQELLNESIKHSNAMMGNVLQAYLESLKGKR